MKDAELVGEYERTLALLVRRSFLSHPSVAAVLEDMLLSDMAIMWELIGSPHLSAPFSERFNDFMEKVQARAAADARVRNAVRAAILAQLQRIEGYVPGSRTQVR